jgi:hypothetical protein
VRTLTTRTTRLARLARRDDTGAISAEYAVATLAACGFGGVLVKLLGSDHVLSLLRKIIEKALGLG